MSIILGSLSGHVTKKQPRVLEFCIVFIHLFPTKYNTCTMYSNNNNNFITTCSNNTTCLIVFFWYRKTIKILFPKEVAERQRNQETSPDYRSVISRFDALDIKPTQRSPSSHEVQFGQHQQMGFSFSKIIFIVFSILGIAMVSDIGFIK